MQEKEHDRMDIILGYTEEGNAIHLNLMKERLLLVAGTMGSGRVTSLHNLIRGLCDMGDKESASVFLLDGSPCSDFAIFKKEMGPQMEIIAENVSDEAMSHSLHSLYQKLKGCCSSGRHIFLFFNEYTRWIHASNAYAKENYNMIRDWLCAADNPFIHVILSTAQGLNGDIIADPEFYDLISTYLIHRSKKADVEFVLKENAGMVDELRYGEGLFVRGDELRKYWVRR